MRPSITHPLAVLALLVGATTATAQVRQPTVRPVAPPATDHQGHGHGARGGPNLPEPAGGKLELEQSSFDAGEVERGGKITHSFVLKNTGTGPLHVDAKPG